MFPGRCPGLICGCPFGANTRARRGSPDPAGLPDWQVSRAHLLHSSASLTGKELSLASARRGSLTPPWRLTEGLLHSSASLAGQEFVLAGARRGSLTPPRRLTEGLPHSSASLAGQEFALTGARRGSLTPPWRLTEGLLHSSASLSGQEFALAEPTPMEGDLRSTLRAGSADPRPALTASGGAERPAPSADGFGRGRQTRARRWRLPRQNLICADSSQAPASPEETLPAARATRPPMQELVMKRVRRKSVQSGSQGRFRTRSA
jgi:hypothetical protein